VKDGFTIESAQESDLPALPAIELAANEMFEGTGLLPAVDDDFTDPDEFRNALLEGHLWVARAPSGEPVGFALVELLGGKPHLEEMDVRPSHGRRGLGRALLEAVFAWARSEGHESVTLTTFRDLPWNAPFYTRAGFRALSADEIDSTLRALVRDEASRGLDPEKRVVMRRHLSFREVGE
jgi:GNAT superfamily N-acetyltransferase